MATKDRTDSATASLFTIHLAKGFKKFLGFISDISQTAVQNQATGEFKINLKSHQRLQKTCQDINNMFQSHDDFESCGKFIKKVWRNFTKVMDKFFPHPDIVIFQLRKEGKVVTMIPGLELGIIIPHLTEVTRPLFWNYLYFIYVYLSKLVGTVNTLPEANQTIIQEMLKQLKNDGILDDPELYNKYLAITENTPEEYSVKSVASSVVKYEIKDLKPEAALETLLPDGFMDTIKDLLAGIDMSELNNTFGMLDEIFDKDPQLTGIIKDALSSCLHALKEEGDTSLLNLIDTIKDAITKLTRDMGRKYKNPKELKSKVKNLFGGENITDIKTHVIKKLNEMIAKGSTDVTQEEVNKIDSMFDLSNPERLMEMFMEMKEVKYKYKKSHR